MPLHKGLEAELSKQLSVINAVIEGNPYFILASPYSDLMTLKAFSRNKKHQYYVRFDEPALNDKVINEVTSALKQTKFVVVSTKDYYGLNDLKTFNLFNKIMAHVKNTFYIVDEYIAPQEENPAIKHVDGFLVLRKR